MGTYFTNLGFSSCEVGGFVASALLCDLRANNFTFTNFPEVDVAWDDDNFHITLKAQGAASSTFRLDYNTARSEIKRFRDKKNVSNQVFVVIQKHAAELEGAASKT